MIDITATEERVRKRILEILAEQGADQMLAIPDDASDVVQYNSLLRDPRPLNLLEAGADVAKYEADFITGFGKWWLENQREHFNIRLGPTCEVIGKDGQQQKVRLELRLTAWN